MRKARNRLAATTRRPQAFPADVVIPPHRGASARTIDPPPPIAKAAPPAPPAKKPKAAKRAAAKRKKKPAQRRRKAVITAPVIALPQRSEPLTEPAIDLAAWSALAPPQLSQPLPRSRAVALQSSGNLLDTLALWLGTRTRQLWRRLGRIEPRGTARPEDELLRLRAENENLRLQLEALLALQTGAGGIQAASSA